MRLLERVAQHLVGPLVANGAAGGLERVGGYAEQDKLQELGCHTTDIGDAMFLADPLWLNRLDQE